MRRTDLALEAKEMYHENAGGTSDIEGVRATTEECDGITVTTVEILNKKGKEALQKEIGTYITIEMPAFRQHGHLFYQSGSHAVKKALHRLTDLQKGDDVLVVGLGNRNITPDALGSLVTDKLIVTRHLHNLMPDAVKNLGTVSCVAPGVMGITGMEIAEIIRQLVPLVKPKAIFAVDALAARSINRISTTVQLSDTGISPGSGIGNRRASLSRDTLGIPVIAIGVPMVIDSETLI
ncbi:MAG: GPR endopeptidase, partial [Clostridia bacterium]|nr:GPR endopeptidase [Clostridia bacterium]